MRLIAGRGDPLHYPAHALFREVYLAKKTHFATALPVSYSNDDGFASSLAGSTVLKITREMTLSDLAEIAEDALGRFQSDDYKQTAFHIIDKVRPISDQALIEKLDVGAVEIIQKGQDNFELSMPGWSEEDVVYYP